MADASPSSAGSASPTTSSSMAPATSSQSLTPVQPSSSSPPPFSSTQGPPTTVASNPSPTASASPTPPLPSSPQPQPTSPADSNPNPNDPGNGSTLNQPNYGTTTANPVQTGINSQATPTQSDSSHNFSISKAIPSTWVEVVDATPTTIAFSAFTSVGGTGFETTWAVTTSVGGHNTTITSYSPGGTDISTSSGNKPLASANRLGLIIGSITGAIVVTFITLFMCKVFHRRRAIQTQERQMTETWVSRPFSRAARNRYKDIDLNIEVHTTTERSQDSLPLHRRRHESFRLRPIAPLSPISMSGFKSPFSSLRRKRGHKLLNVGSISSPVGPITVQGDSSVLQSALQSGSPQAQDPFLDDGDEKSHSANSSASTVTTPPQLSVLAEVTEEPDHPPSQILMTTEASLAYNHPLSASILSRSTHLAEASPFSGYFGSADPSAAMPSTHSSLSSTRSHLTSESQDSIRLPF